MVNINSIVFNTDSYKVSMWKQYPPGTEYVYSYTEARGGVSDEVMVAGVTSFVKNVLAKRVTREEVILANNYWTMHGEPFNLEGWLYIADELEGKLPLMVRAAEEGMVIPTKNVLMTIENTDPKVPWLTTWVETAALRAIWYPSSVATVSYEIKKVIKRYLEISGTPEDIDFKLHDFGARGASSNESASLGAMAHLYNFKGTDTYVGALRIMNDYGAMPNEVGFSIPAAEHSTITSWGKDNEKEAYANMVKQFSSPGSVYAVVSDSYDIYESCRIWGTDLKDQVVSSGGTLVIRPDSGDPVEVLQKCCDILAKGFGVTHNAKGFAVLNNVRLIWGDGITKATISKILDVMVGTGWSADNFAFGMGGALLNNVHRDDLGWAMKCSAVCINGKWQDVSKDPITDPGKKSKEGRVVLYRENGRYYSGVEDWNMGAISMLTVFIDGQQLNTPRFVDVRANANKGM